MGDWEKTLQVLRPADVTNMEGAVFSIDEDDMERERYHKRKKTAPQQVVGQAEGYRTVSQIWTMEGAFDKVDKKEMEGGMYTSHRFACWLISSSVVHVEWLKSRACVHRWWEEVSLVKAEMEHSLISLEYYASEWES